MRKTVKAKGNAFFSFTETFPYRTSKAVFGQNTPDSCVAAVCRMLLADNRIEILEYHLRSSLKITEQGALISSIPEVLREFGLNKQYECLSDLSFENLQNLTKFSPAIVTVRKKGEKAGHALMVDSIIKQQGKLVVLIRDSLPVGQGGAYKIAAEIFREFWLRENDLRGSAVVIKFIEGAKR